MQVIQFKNGERAQCLGVHSQQTSHQGVARDSLIFLFDPSVDPSEISELFTPENMASFSLTEEAGEQTQEFWHEGYTICTGYGKGMKERVLGNMGFTSPDGLDEIVTWVQMVQATAQERMLQSQQGVLDMLILNALNE